MRRFSELTQGTGFLRGLGLLWSFGFLVAACDGSPVGLFKPEVYQITEGACGEVVFLENLGLDLASAIEILKERKIEQFGDVALETYRLELMDQSGNTPQGVFHAVRVLEGDTPLLAHSVVDVVTSDGDLFHLEWCPD
ncbi:MAG: hypothetical protein WEA34_03460 [Gemmatimonadota bacterium]